MKVLILSGSQAGAVVEMERVEAESALATGYAEAYVEPDVKPARPEAEPERKAEKRKPAQ